MMTLLRAIARALVALDRAVFSVDEALEARKDAARRIGAGTWGL